MQEFVSLIIENSKGQVLLQLRDDKPDIPYPNHWAVLGGKIEEGETREEALRREMMEEIELVLDDFQFLCELNINNQKIFLYKTNKDLDVNKTPLHEGQKIEFFYEKKAFKLKLKAEDKEMLKYFFNN